MRALVFLISLVPFSAAAAVLTWEDCVRLAIQNNAELRAANDNKKAIEYKEGVARAGLLPSFSGNVGYSRVKGANDSDWESSYSAELSASQNLFSGFHDFGRVKQAAANADAAKASLEQVKAKVSYDLRSAFENLAYSKEYISLSSEIVRRREENLRLVDLRFQSGRENKGSLYLSQAYLNQAKYDDLQAQNAHRVALAQLARAIGIDEFAGYDIRGSAPIRTPGQVRPNFRGLAVVNPEYVRAVAEEVAAEAAVSVARSGFFPSLDLTGSVGREAEIFFPQSRNRWSMGIMLSLPLFDGGQDLYDTKSAVASLSFRASERVSISRLVLAKLEQAYAEYLEAVAKLGVDESFRKAATVRAEIARKRYNNGLMSFEDWDGIENDLISHQKAYLQSKKARGLAEAAWDQAQGKGVIP